MAVNSAFAEKPEFDPQHPAAHNYLVPGNPVDLASVDTSTRNKHTYTKSCVFRFDCVYVWEFASPAVHPWESGQLLG